MSFMSLFFCFFFFSSRRRHTRSLHDWSSDVCSSDLDDLGKRTYADIGLVRVPPEVRGRLNINPAGALLAAEFHACTWNFSTESCPDQQALGRVRSEERRVGKECRSWWAPVQ